MALITTKHLKDFADKFAAKASEIFAKKIDIPDSFPADGGNADTVNGHTVDTDVPAGAKFTDTTYSVMGAATTQSAGQSGLVPAPPAGEGNAFLNRDGTWVEIEEATDADIDAIIAGTFK